MLSKPERKLHEQLEQLILAQFSVLAAHLREEQECVDQAAGVEALARFSVNLAASRRVSGTVFLMKFRFSLFVHSQRCCFVFPFDETASSVRAPLCLE